MLMWCYMLYAECCILMFKLSVVYAKYRYVECRFPDCRGAILTPSSQQ